MNRNGCHANCFIVIEGNDGCNWQPKRPRRRQGSPCGHLSISGLQLWQNDVYTWPWRLAYVTHHGIRFLRIKYNLIWAVILIMDWHWSERNAMTSAENYPLIFVVWLDCYLTHRGRVSDTYMRQYVKPSPLQMMVSYLFGIKPLSKPMMPCC